MNRKIPVALTLVLLAGSLAAPVRACPEPGRMAQSSDPPSQTSQTSSPQATAHVVQRGETLFSIAQQYGVTVDAITHANHISDPRQVYVGQRLVIPGSGTTTQATVSFLVQAGDTLYTIARRYRTTWQTLVQINRLLSPNTLYVGQVIQVPASGNPTGEVAAQSQAAGDLVYVVRPGDTLPDIARRYNISPWTLATMNHIASPALLYPGQELVVPGAGPGLLPAPFSAVEIQPLPVSQGTTMIVAVRTTEPVTVSGRLLERTVSFAEEGGVYYGLVGLDVRREPGLYELEVTAVDGKGQETAFTTGVLVQSGRYGYARIMLSSSNDQSAYALDHERLDPLRGTFTPERHWTLPLQRPCRGTISDYFGIRRAYNDGPYTSYHTGVDFRAPGGSPVYASAGGTVILAERLAIWGNAIVIDHGWGLLTGYAHLSAIEVQVGQQVTAGDPIGKVGSTGASTGPHLHWEVWVGGVPVNGLQWLEEFYSWPGAEQAAIGG